MARPRSISKDDTLERALLLFWERGYDRTSIADLSEAIGVGPSSLYNSFGSKDGLFREALDRYVATYADPAMQVIGTDNGERAAEFVGQLLRKLATFYTSKDHPAGCAIFQSGGAGMPAESSSCAITAEVKAGLTTAIRRRLEACAKAGDDLAASPRTLAQFIVGTLRGLSQLACDGASRPDLLRVADHAARSVER